MRIDKSKISGARFLFTIALFLQSSSLLPSFSTVVIDHEVWITYIIGAILMIPIIYLYKTLMVMFPNKNLIQVFKLTFGKVIGTIIAVLFFVFCFTLTAINLEDFVDFSKLTVMYETPKYVLMIAAMAIIIFAVRHGLSVVVRYSAMLTLINIVIIILSIIMLFNQMDIENLAPLFSRPFKNYVQATHIAASLPISELVVLLMITPNVHIDRKKITKQWFLGFGLGVLLTTLVLLRDTAVLGNLLSIFNLPALVTYKLINFLNFISRVEILFASILVILLCFKVLVLFYITVVALCEILGLKNFKHISAIMGAAVIVYSLTIYTDNVMHKIISTHSAPFFWSILGIVIPIVTFFVIKIRGLDKGEHSTNRFGRYSKKTTFKKVVIKNQKRISKKSW